MSNPKTDQVAERFKSSQPHLDSIFSESTLRPLRFYLSSIENQPNISKLFGETAVALESLPEMYQFPGNPSFSRPPGYGSFAGAPSPSPGLGGPPNMAPPGMAPPGVAPAPGSVQLNAQPNRPGAFPPNFAPSANMPNINFSAPVIRLGTTGPSKPAAPSGDGRRDGEQRSGRPGLGAGQGADAQRSMRDGMQQHLLPPTTDEVVRTMFVGAITEGAGGDDGIQRIMSSAGHLRRWTRATDADDKPCTFGFAEFEDAESLATALEVLKTVDVPVAAQMPKAVDAPDVTDEPVEKSQLLVLADEGSLEYLKHHQASRGDQDPIQHQLRVDAAKANLAAVLRDLSYPSAATATQETLLIGREGDGTMSNGNDNHEAEIVTIPLSVEDELSDIPAEMRETVAKEIASFRDRSTRRDLERLKREEEIEAMERQRNQPQPRSSRLVSPPASVGPGAGSNGIPVGPRDRAGLHAPAGPKRPQGPQAREYQKGVAFVNGTGINGASGGWIDREDDDSDASDEELERRRTASKEAELEKLYLDQERRWLNREKSRTAAVAREKARADDDDSRREAERELAAKRLRAWNDEVESRRKTEDYYADRSLWIRNRAASRAREAHLDDLDRAAEEREALREQQHLNAARGLADDFLNRQALELESKSQLPREPQRFKLSLGAAAAQKAQAAASSSSRRRRTAADVEGLLEDEEEADATAKRTLVPIKFDSAAEAAGLSEEERTQAVKQLAAEIPSDSRGLWAWPVRWEFVDDAVVAEQLKPFVEKKIVEYLGVQEQMLVEVVEEHLRKQGAPQDLVEQLEGALDDEAEVLVRKLWRMLIFFSESEKRGLSAS